MSTEYKQLTLYTTKETLVEIAKTIDEILKKRGFVGKYELIRVEIRAGQPRGDMGQTINISYVERLEAYDRRNNKEVLFGW